MNMLAASSELLVSFCFGCIFICFIPIERLENESPALCIHVIGLLYSSLTQYCETTGLSVTADSNDDGDVNGSSSLQRLES